MYRIATVTFHHAHNFGSVLQAYALQEFIQQLFWEKGEEVQYQIINYYTEKQEKLYDILKQGLGAKNLIKNAIALCYIRDLKTKHDKFEVFLEQKCNLTKLYRTIDELIKDVPVADCYISGSDQLWNVRAKDFSDVYFLNFIKNGKKISYAASFGPLKINWSRYNVLKYKNLLKQYDAISVREPESKKNIEYLIAKESSVNVDPTLLLTKEQWRLIQSNADYEKGNYIFLYCLEPTKQQLCIANAISHKLGLPILILRYNNKYDILNHYVKKYDAGPEDFLAYIDHAALVLSSSFHGTAFSLIYNKPFYVFNGMNDNRISSLLTKTEMTERVLEKIEDIDKIVLDPPDNHTIETVLKNERDLSKEYFRRAFQLE